MLDAGCGSGNLARKLIHQDAEVICLDFSSFALEIAKKKIPRSIFITHTLGEGRIPLGDESVDSIVCNNVLYAIPRGKREVVIREFFRILRFGGRIALANPAPGFNDFTLLQDHLSSMIKSHGVWYSIFGFLALLPKLLMLFYYNRRIDIGLKMEKKDLLSEADQQDLLGGAGFQNIHSSRIYSKQAVLSVASKV